MRARSHRRSSSSRKSMPRLLGQSKFGVLVEAARAAAKADRAGFETALQITLTSNGGTSNACGANSSPRDTFPSTRATSMANSTIRRQVSKELPDEPQLENHMKTLKAEVAEVRRVQQENSCAIRSLLYTLVQRTGCESEADPIPVTC